MRKGEKMSSKKKKNYFPIKQLNFKKKQIKFRPKGCIKKQIMKLPAKEMIFGPNS